MGIVRDLLTGPSNRHYDLGRCGLALSLLAALAYQAYAIWQGHPFGPLEFGGGIAAILGAGGFGISMKDTARPKGMLDGEEVA